MEKSSGAAETAPKPMHNQMLPPQEKKGKTRMEPTGDAAVPRLVPSIPSPTKEEDRRRAQWKIDWEQAQTDKKSMGYGDWTDKEILSYEIGNDWAPEEQSKVLDLQSRIGRLSKERVLLWKKPTFEMLSLEQLFKRPPKEWLVDHLFGAGDIGMIYGPPGCGKTFVVIDMMMSMSFGTKCCDNYGVTRPLRVWYFAGEGGGGLPDRFLAAAKHHGADGVNGLRICEKVPQLLTDGDVKNLIQEVSDSGDLPPEVVVVDTLHSASYGAEENSSKDMGNVLGNVKKLVEAWGCAAIIVHHTNKGGTAERGSSALRGDTSFLLEVRSPVIAGQRTEGAISHGQLYASKIKDAKDGYSINFNLAKSSEADSLHVNWFEIKEGKLTGSEEEKRGLILQAMTASPEKRFTRDDVAELLSIDKVHATKLLTSLFDNKKCKKETMNGGKKSPSNPWTYHV